MVNRSSKLLLIVLAITALIVSAGVSHVQAGTYASFSGVITSGADFHRHAVDLVEGIYYTADLVCADGTLDPVLSVFDPNGVMVAYNDDGGTPCNSFRSSHVTFRAPSDGTFQFQADGFGSSTGPYTLTVVSDLNPGRPIPDGFVLVWLSCSTAVFDAPGGQPVGDDAVWAGQSWYVNPTPVKDASGKSWTEIFVSGTTNAYIPTSCIK